MHWTAAGCDGGGGGVNNNSLTQTKAKMTKQMMRTQNKHKRVPILPTHKCEDGGYSQ